MAIQQASLAAASAVVAIQTDVGSASLVGGTTVGVNVVSSFVGVLSFEGTLDGSNWFAVAGYPLQSVSGIIGSPAISVATGTTGRWIIPAYGYAQVRVRASTYTSGTALVQLDVNNATSGQFYAITEGCKTTYSASVSAAALATAGTDLFQLVGSATATVRVTKVAVSGTIATAAQYTSISLIRRSAAGTGGAAGTVPTVITYDTGDAAASAVPAVYTTSPTSLGATTNGGVIASRRYFGVLTGTAAPLTEAVFEFGNRPSRALLLKGTSQILCVNVGVAALGNASTWDCYVEWTEEV